MSRLVIKSVNTEIRKDRPSLSEDITFSKLSGFTCYQVVFTGDIEGATCEEDKNLVYNDPSLGFYARSKVNPFLEYANRVLNFLNDFKAWLDNHNKKFIHKPSLDICMLLDSRQEEYASNTFAHEWFTIQNNTKDNKYTLSEAITVIEDNAFRYHKFIKSVVAPIEEGVFNNIPEFILFLQDYINKH